MQRLILLAKRPRLGRVKTRLVPPLTAAQALELYRAFLDDSARLAAGFGASRQSCGAELCLDGAVGDEGLPPSAALLPHTLQGRGDLGERLHRAFERSAAAGSSATVIIGADSPSLPPDHVHAAFRRLAEGAEAVIAPATDGGYVLIGLAAPRVELFTDIPWGGPAVAEATRERAQALGLALVELAPWYDVDDERGLRRLRDDLRGPGGTRSPATTAHLRSLDGPYSGVI